MIQINSCLHSRTEEKVKQITVKWRHQTIGREGCGGGKDYALLFSLRWVTESSQNTKQGEKERLAEKPLPSLLSSLRPEKNAPSGSRHPTCSTKASKLKSPGSSQEQLEATPPPAQGHTHAAPGSPGSRHCTIHVTAWRGQRSVAMVTKRRGRSKAVFPWKGIRFVKSLFPQQV